MITGYGGFYGEPENQGYYVGAEAVDFQYQVSFLSWYILDDHLPDLCKYLNFCLFYLGHASG